MSIEVHKAKTFLKTINTKFVNDKSLSLKAKGILIYLLSKPPNWKGQLFDIAQSSPDGRKSVRAGMRELVANGYAKIEAKPMKDGKFQGKHYCISDQKNFFENEII